MQLLDRIEGKIKFKFSPWFFVFIAMPLIATIEYMRHATGFIPINSTAFAIYGALTACCGVITIGRPVIRSGGYRTWYKNSQICDGGDYPKTKEQIEEERQGYLDAVAVQFTGPSLVIIGTMINGISGAL